MPLPPYIERPRSGCVEDRSHYQTIFAKQPGAVAAPTAGLHFTDQLLERLRGRGIERVDLTLHVGGGTFLPVKAERIEDHEMHREWGSLSEEAVRRINDAKAAGRRVIAVGTTSLRLMESALDADGRLRPFEGETVIFIKPGHRVRSADLLLTNFHLPRSTLFILVATFSGLERMKGAYAHAKANGYRFFSYGDACLLTREDLIR
jgi:S-adenosylmethionine:tRNA ribosyltransferase-isomerase